ncbi:hypothetical protein LASUN_02430 [Lentilactobacillus sunkii]|jgi:hypothetical protein|uniref:Uncharacterized protein n=1 Tax=Lentilactobacillus sunkii TaxID=481719 RepID=A0A1E7XJE5_9LACO|nr:hypothetical protein LASUN_02430 [Lentilactobacillus sunkii]
MVDVDKDTMGTTNVYTLYTSYMYRVIIVLR